MMGVSQCIALFSAAAMVWANLTSPVQSAEKEIDRIWVDTHFPPLPQTHILIERASNDDIKGIDCYITLPDIGGFLSLFGAQHVPYNFSVQCIQTGPIRIVGDYKKDKDLLDLSGEEIVSRLRDRMDSQIKAGRKDIETALENLYIKRMRLSQHFDEERDVLTYTIWASYLIQGDTESDISSVSIRSYWEEPVHTMFLQILERAPTEDERILYAGMLKRGSTIGEVREAIAKLQPVENRLAEIIEIFLDRAMRPEERDKYVNEMALGSSMAQVISDIRNGSEYRGRRDLKPQTSSTLKDEKSAEEPSFKLDFWVTTE